MQSFTPEHDTRLAAIQQCNAVLDSSQRIVITAHINPDADAIGSTVALMLSLKAQGKDACVILSDAVPSFLSFLPGTSDVRHYSSERDDSVIQNADCIVCVDFNTMSRCGSLGSVIESSAAHRMLVDHHDGALSHFDSKLHDINATSSAELVYLLIAHAGSVYLTPEICTNLYAGLMADTGNFRFPRVNGNTHRIVAQLIDCGADPVMIYDTMINTWTIGRIQLLGAALESLEIHFKGQLCLMIVSQDMLARNGCSEEDLESLVQYTLTIEGVRCGVLISERVSKGEIKMSFRSKGEFSVNTIAGRFGGGGHRHAAGARKAGASLASVRDEVLQAVQSSPDLYQ